MSIQFVVVGTGRCGTGFVSKCLSSVGIPCGHEEVFQPHDNIEQRLSSSKLRAESSWLAAPHLTNRLLRDTKIIHVVREPLKTISSLVSALFPVQSHPYTDYAVLHVPELRELRSPVEKAACFYVRWNLMIEKLKGNKPYFFTRVEDILSPGFLHFLCVPTGSSLFSDTKRGTRTSAFPSDLRCLPPTIKRSLDEMSSRYGYGSLA
jgi:hypothetical protein